MAEILDVLIFSKTFLVTSLWRKLNNKIILEATSKTVMINTPIIEISGINNSNK